MEYCCNTRLLWNIVVTAPLSLPLHTHTTLSPHTDTPTHTHLTRTPPAPQRKDQVVRSQVPQVVGVGQWVGQAEEVGVAVGGL